MASEADLLIPDLTTFSAGGINGRDILFYGIIIIILGVFFGLLKFLNTKKLESHKSMLNVSETIYETCKTYLFQQGKFLVILFLIICF
jgi:K(+)-stimulated pyrophosphate-energized sodium pump